MLTLADSWVWDFWLADDGEEFHLFFLHAPRALEDPGLRHVNARVGHATSPDLRSWTRHADALAPGPPGAVDDVATWTGSVVRDPAGGWRMFYTGLASRGTGHVQRITAATSDDLFTWDKDGSFCLAPDGRWYAIGGHVAAGDQTGDTWRDPWVFPDPAGDGWHMLITARAATGPEGDDGVVGHAWSPDLRSWTLRPPLSAPGAGFQHLEVFQVEVVDGRAALLFSCLPGQTTEARRRRDGAAGSWTVAPAGPLGPFDTTAARPLTDDRHYSARLIRNRAGQWVLLAFLDEGPDGFVGQRTGGLAASPRLRRRIRGCGASAQRVRPSRPPRRQGRPHPDGRRPDLLRRTTRPLAHAGGRTRTSRARRDELLSPPAT